MNRAITVGAGLVPAPGHAPAPGPANLRRHGATTRVAPTIGILAVLPLALMALASPALAQGEGGRYYSQTGHTLDARFVAFFDGHGGEAILGYPITDSFIDPQSGWRTQYLENARLELAPEGSAGVVGIRLSALGEALGGWQAPLTPDQIPAPTDATCRFYAESGHSVCHAFLDFYLSHGGPAQFGFPISEFKLEGERIVQYLQAFRFDWYPEAAPEARVRLAPLGRQHFEAMGYDPALLRPRLPSDIQLYQVLELRPRVSVAHPVLGTDGRQTVFVAVRDQNLNPVAGATVVLTIHLAEGDRIVLLPVTDERGLSQISFDYAGQPRGSSVALDGTAVLDRLQALTRDSFLIWY